MALMAIRASVNWKTVFIPYELLTGRVMPGPGAQFSPIGEGAGTISYKPYFEQLKCLVSSFSKQVAVRQVTQTTEEGQETTHIRLKVIKRKWSEPR